MKYELRDGKVYKEEEITIEKLIGRIEYLEKMNDELYKIYCKMIYQIDNEIKYNYSKNTIHLIISDELLDEICNVWSN